MITRTLKKLFQTGVLVSLVAGCGAQDGSSGSTAVVVPPVATQASAATATQADTPATAAATPQLPTPSAAQVATPGSTEASPVPTQPAPATVDGVAILTVSSRSQTLIGGTSGGKWLTAEETAPLLKGGESYTVYGLDKVLGQATAQAPQPAESPCGDSLKKVTLTPQSFALPEDAVVAVSGATNRQVQVPRSEPTTEREGQETITINAPFLQEITAFLQPQPIGANDIQLMQVLHVDIEGDGVEEALIHATYRRTPDPSQPSSPDFASMLVLRKLVDNRPEILPISQDGRLTLKLLGLLDLNGDGTLEVILEFFVLDFGGQEVYTIEGTTIKQVLNTGCGV